MNIRWDARLLVQEMVNEGVRRAHLLSKGRVSRVDRVGPRLSAARTRATTRRPWYTIEIAPGVTVEVKPAAEGDGCESRSNFAMLKPSDSIAGSALKTVLILGAGWFPPDMLGSLRSRAPREIHTSLAHVLGAE